MGAAIWNWIIVYSDGRTETVRGETPEDALDGVDWNDQYDIVGMIRNGWN